VQNGHGIDDGVNCFGVVFSCSKSVSGYGGRKMREGTNRRIAVDFVDGGLGVSEFVARHSGSQ